MGADAGLLLPSLAALRLGDVGGRLGAHLGGHVPGRLLRRPQLPVLSVERCALVYFGALI